MATRAATAGVLRHREIQAELQALGVSVRYKREFWLMRLIGFFFGKWFRESAWTTISTKTIWAPSGADLTRLDRHETVIRHELVHVRQMRWFPWPLRWVWHLSYLLLPVPFGFAWFRWRWEREAYMVQLCEGERTVNDVVDVLCGWKYGLTWPKPWARKWFIRESCDKHKAK